MSGRRAAMAVGAGGQDDCCLHDSEVGTACFSVETVAGAMCRKLAEELFVSERRLKEMKGKDEVGAYGWEEVVFDWCLVPLCLLLVVFLIWSCLSRVYDRFVSNSEARQSWVALYTGSSTRTPQHPRFVAALEFIQTVLSLLIAMLFIENTLYLRETASMLLFHQCSSVFLTFHFLFRGLQNEFLLRSCFDIEALVDILTIPGLVYKRHSWLSLDYLRTVSALRAYVRLERLLNLHLSLGPVSHGLLHMFLELMSLVMCFACSIFTLEVLGEVPGMHGASLTTGMGEITVFRMIYWSMETLTTVGYGEYVPTTFLSRLLTMICMMGGLVFFAQQIGKMQDIVASVKSGFRVFMPGTSKHVVLMGGCVRQFDSNLLGGFLNEIYHPKNEKSWPDMAVMGAEQSDLNQFRAAVEDHFRNVRPMDSPLNRIHYVVGSPLVKKDLTRCHCDKAFMVYIVSDSSITEKSAAEEEDKLTTLCTVSFKRHFPGVPYRVALLEGKSLERAYGAGIQGNRVFSINVFRGALLCECARCPGWSTMVEHFLTTSSPVLERIPKDSWQYKYLQGRSMGIHGFLAADDFCGRPANEFVKEAYRRGGACIMARARPYSEGGRHMELMPSSSADELVTKETIYWAMCSNSELQLQGIRKKADPRDWKTDWEEVFKRQRKDAFIAKHGSAEFRRELEGKYKSRGSRHAMGPNQSTTVGSHDDGRSPIRSHSVNQQDVLVRFGATMDDRRMEIIEKQKDKGLNFVLLLDFSETWAEVMVFLKTCRQPHLPAKMPVIVLSKTPLSEKDVELIDFVMEHDDIAIFEGNPEVEKDLISCGALDCCSIICVGNECQNDGCFADADVLLAYGLLHQLHLVDKTILLEFQDPEHMCLLPNDYSVGQRDSDPTMAATEDITDADCTYTFDPHFVSGEVFLPRFMGTLMGGVVRSKGTVELMQRLCMPSLPHIEQTGNPVAVWQIRVPRALRGQSYGRLFGDLMGEDQPAVALGLRRSLRGGHQGVSCAPSRDMEAPLIDGGPSQPPRGAVVLTNPPADEVVLDDDIIFVLAGQRVAEGWMRDGLLLNFGYSAPPV